MRAEKSFWAGAGIGLTSILTVLLVLVLSIFSVLSLFTAQADERLSRANADAVSAYYAADARACRVEEDFARSGEAERAETVPMTQTSAPLRTSLIGSFVSTNAVITLIERNRRCLAKWEYVLSPDMIFMY